MSQEIGPVTPCHAMSLVVTLTKDCASPLDVKDYLCMMSKTNAVDMEICVVMSILQLYLPEPIHSQGHYKLNVRKADYKLL